MSNAPLPKKKKQPNQSKKAQKASRGDFVDQVRPKNAFRLSPCAEKYLDSVLDPFTGPADACVPNWPSFPSQKVRVFARGALNIGTAGMGFITARPCAASDIVFLYYSGSTYVGSSVTNTGTGVNPVNNNSPFIATTFSAALAQRLVSFGVRVRYTGTELNRGGAIYTLEQPEHSTLIGATIPTMRETEQCHSFPVDKEWTQICWLPSQASELEYYASQYAPNTNGSSDNTGFPLAIAIQSTAGNSFEFEVFASYECIGSLARGKTKADTDLTGLGVVTGALRSGNEGVVDRNLVLHKDKRPSKGSSLPGIMKTVGKYAWDQLSGFLSDPGKLANVAGMLAPMIMA